MISIELGSGRLHSIKNVKAQHITSSERLSDTMCVPWGHLLLSKWICLFSTAGTHMSNTSCTPKLCLGLGSMFYTDNTLTTYKMTYEYTVPTVIAISNRYITKRGISP